MELVNIVWGIVKPSITKYYVAFFCGGTVWMLLDVYVTKGIDASFISAVMDFSLVLFAILAFYQARKIWVDRAKQDGYKIALDLLNNKFFSTANHIELKRLIFRNEKVINAYQKLLDNYSGCNQDISKEGNYIIFLKKHSQELYNQLKNTTSPLAKEVKSDLFRIRNMSVSFSQNKSGKMLKKHFEDFIYLDAQCTSYYRLLRGAVFFHDENIISSDIDELAKELEGLKLHNHKIKEILERIKSNFDLMLEDECLNIVKCFNF